MLRLASAAKLATVGAVVFGVVSIAGSGQAWADPGGTGTGGSGGNTYSYQSGSGNNNLPAGNNDESGNNGWQDNQPDWPGQPGLPPVLQNIQSSQSPWDGNQGGTDNGHHDKNGSNDQGQSGSTQPNTDPAGGDPSQTTGDTGTEEAQPQVQADTTDQTQGSNDNHPGDDGSCPTLQDNNQHCHHHGQPCSAPGEDSGWQWTKDCHKDSCATLSQDSDHSCCPRDKQPCPVSGPPENPCPEPPVDNPCPTPAPKPCPEHHEHKHCHHKQPCPPPQGGKGGGPVTPPSTPPSTPSAPVVAPAAATAVTPAPAELTDTGFNVQFTSIIAVVLLTTAGFVFTRHNSAATK